MKNNRKMKNELIVEPKFVHKKGKNPETLLKKRKHIEPDITQRKRLQEESIAPEEYYSSTFEKSQDGLLLVHRSKGDILDSNACAQELLGYSKEEFLKNNLWGVGVVKDDKDFQEALSRLERDGVIYYDNRSVINKAGLLVNAEVILVDKVKFIQCNVRDNTKRKRAEEQLRQSEELFRLITENATDLIAVLDLEGKRIYSSPSYKSILGDPESLRATDSFQEIHPEDREKIRNIFLETVRTGIGQRAEYRFLLKDGSVRYIESQGSVIRDENGNTIKVVVVSREVTERKQAEKQIGLLAHTLKSVAECVSITDLNDIVLFVNNAFLKTYGYTEQEILGKNINIVRSPNTPPGATRGILATTLAGGWSGELLNRTKDGREFQVSLSTSFVRDEKGQDIALVGIATDITERKHAEEELRKSEERFKLIFEYAPDAFYLSDLKGNFIAGNKAAEKITGYEKEELIGGSFLKLNLLSFDQLPKAATLLAKNIIGKPTGPDEFILKRKTGDKVFVEIITHPVKFEKRILVLGIARDITERKQAEEELNKSEEKYRSIFENIQDVYYETLFDGTILEVSPSIEIISKGQYNRADLIGRSMFEFYADAQDRNAVIEVIQKTGSVTDFEVQLKNRDSSVIPCSISAKIIFDAEGRPEKIIGSMHDISERKRAEEALKKNEEKLKDMFESAPVGYQEMDAQGNISAVNQTELKMTGFSYKEMIGWPVWEFVSDREEARKRVLDKLAGNLPPNKNSERIIVRRDGSTFPAIIDDIVLRNEQGVITGIRTTMVDITERKRVEDALIYERNLLRSLMDNVPDHIYFKDTNSRFLQLSKSLAERFGVSDPAQAIGKTDFDFFAEEHASSAYENEQEIIKTGIPLVNIEEKETWPGGGETWVSTTKVPLRDLNGQIIGTFGISRDVTEQKKMQSQLMQTQKVQSIGTLAGGIAHDFNNILGIILAYTSVLERSEGDKEKISKSTTAITQAVSRGAALVRQILTFARQTGAIVKPLLIPDLVNEIVIMLKETFPEVIEFKTTIENNIPFINADHTQIHQVLLNLCVNARDAMHKGGIIGIEVKTVTSETLIQQFPEVKSGRYVIISVSDTGIGMDNATKHRIFDPFFTTKEQGKGTGLGLSVVYGVIQDHHGFISVESKVGQGTTFHLYLPVPQEEKKTQENKNIKVEELQRGSETILFVEDEELLREVVQSTLEANGYKVLLATNGREAVEIYKKQYKDIALVLSDMGLPKLGGIDVYTLLKKINPKIKIIFASGFISLETRSELFKTGVKGIIQKPYGVHEVLQMVREVLDENGEKNE